MFAAFCFIIRVQSLGVLSSTQFQSSVENASTACGLHVEPEAFKNELMKTICLLQQDGFEISFIHKSVAQYYAASFIASSNESFAEKFYNRAANGDARAWQLELRFLSEIDAYRWNKFFEIPLLDRIATAIGWDFKDSSERAKIYLRNHLSRSITLLVRENEVGTQAFGWLRPLSKDPVLEELGGVWADEINRYARDSPEFQKILSAKYVKEDHGDTAEYTVKTSDMLEEIVYHIPDLEDSVLAHLKKRRDASLKILELENEKINLFNLLE